MRNCPRCGAPQADGVPTCDLCGMLFPGEKKPKTHKRFNFAGVFGLLCAILAVGSTILIFAMAEKMDIVEDPYETMAVVIFLLVGVAGAITFPFAGMILSIIGLKKNKTPNMTGKGFGIAGIILSSMTLVVSVLLILFIVFFFIYELGST